MKELLEDDPGREVLLLGNEAIVRGALEAGIGHGSTYPGTPSSEIGNTFEKIAKEYGMYFEYSANEKVAMETAAAAAVSGVRSMVWMKHVGVNVASDALMTLMYAGTRAGMVIVAAGDPSTHSSQNEQDNRYYSLLGNIPMLEPITPHEAKEMTKEAFDISEELELPVLVRTTTRVNHARGVVTFDDLNEPDNEGHFDKDPGRFVSVPQNARKNHPRLLEQMEKAGPISEESRFTEVIDENDPELHVISSGAGFNYIREAKEEYDLPVSILKLGMTNPLPLEKTKEYIEGAERVLVVEELEPFLEEKVKALAKEVNPDLEIYGKKSGHLSRLYEYNPDRIKEALAELIDFEDDTETLRPGQYDLPSRPPSLCPGCPHRGTYYSVKQALGDKEAVFSSDIGCYTLGVQDPLNTADFLLCMGSSVGAAGGFSKNTDQQVFAFLGDSTFFHSGLAPLVSGVYNDHDFVYVIMDNRTTAMTGHQPHPGTGRTGMGDQAPMLSIEELAEGAGVEFVETVDPYDIEETTEVFERAIEHDGISVVVPKHPCALIEQGEVNWDPYQVDQEECRQCHVCTNKFGCIALVREGEKVIIDETQCVGCGQCAQICPFDAIKQEGEE
ncbi:MAG: indolepyruvate ferredoxin oxidoreductase subunit alpha [Candidatus Thermoplasmatota archaeon]|nr:indolepyruvate ferredoxin oxidoreductase subunit alpha [Candidatus Thermoplasmatota archaeon]